LNPFYCELNENNPIHKDIISFIEKNYINQENFESKILDSFSIYFDEIPLDLITFISYFWLDDEYSEEDIYWNVSSFIYDNLESYMIDKISIYQVCHEIKQNLEYEDHIIVFVEAINKNDTVFRVFQKKSDYEVNHIKDIIYTNEELEKEKLRMIRNHAELLGDSLSMELKHRKNSKKNFTKIITNTEEIDENLFLNNKIIAFDNNILNINKEVKIDFKYYELLQSIQNTLNKSFLHIIKNIINNSKLIEELTIKLNYLNIKLSVPKNEKKPAQLNYFCNLLIENKFDYEIIEKNENESYLPFLLDLITAPYLIKSLNKNHIQYIEFFKIVNDKNLYSYLVKYFSEKYFTEENIIRNILRFLHTEDNSIEKRFAKQKIDNFPSPPINLTFKSYKFIKERMLVTKIE